MNKLLITVAISVITLFFLGLVAFLIWFPISPLNTVFNLSFEKQVSGSVYNCETNDPIENATVTMSGTGWAWDNGPIWDKIYKSTTKSFQNGTFELKYNLGTSLSAKKDGYLDALKYTYSAKDVKIGMVKMTDENKNESPTYDCKLSSECYVTKVINGVQTSWDACANPELNKELE